MKPTYETRADRILRADWRRSVVAIELEACEPWDVVEMAAAHGVHAELAHNGGHGWPVYRYTGTLWAIGGWLADQYEDGSGEPWWELVGRLLYGETSPCPCCGAPVLVGESLSGPLEPDGVVHWCPDGDELEGVRP